MLLLISFSIHPPLFCQVRFDLAAEIHADFDLDVLSINYADLDNDGDTDVVLGHQIYLNQGNGSLIEKTGAISLSKFGRSSSVGDVDSDGDVDVFIIEEGILFLNDGNASFSSYDTPMQELSPYFDSEDGVLVDLDLDGDMDCFLYDFNQDPRVFLNDGSANFQEVENTIFPKMSSTSKIYTDDLNEDGKEDIIINGLLTYDNPITEIYLNNEGLSFNKLPFEFPPVFYASMKFGDLDGDGSKDIVVIGEDTEGVKNTEILMNDGDLNFSSVDHSMKDISRGSVEMIDVDVDSDLDVVLTGTIKEPGRKEQETTLLYINDGNGNFTEGSSNFDQVMSAYGGLANGTSKVDIDNDGDDDLILTGYQNGSRRSNHLYLNDGKGTFKKITTSPFPNLQYSTTITGDINNDGWSDVIITGSEFTNTRQTTCQVFFSDQQNGFILNQAFHGAHRGDLEFIDFDLDGDLDFIITGEQKGDSGPGYSNPLFSGVRTRLYENDGSGNYEEMVDHPFEDTWYSSIEVIDFDGDEDNDLIIMGRSASFATNTNVYENNGSGKFTLAESNIADLGSGDLDSGDLDGDGDIDLVITGYNNVVADGGRKTKIYYNDGNGQFEDSGLELVGFSDGSINIGDTDSDGDLDFIQSGQVTRFGGHGLPLNIYTFHYRNNGDGTFSRELINDVGALEFCSSHLVDLDNDKDLDYLVTGQLDGQFSNFLDHSDAKVYLNDGWGRFFEIGTEMKGSYSGSISVLDFDDDGLQDVLFSGDDESGGSATRLYRNKTNTENIPSVLNHIEDQVYNQGFGSASFDLSLVFPDSEVDINYWGTVDDTRIIEGSFDSHLNLVLSEGSQPGEANVTVTAVYQVGYLLTEAFKFSVNSLPRVNNPIEDQQYTQGFGSSRIDVSERYSDPDGDNLIISVAVLDEDVVVATYNDGLLTLNEGLEVGETEITITIDDGNTGIVTDSFRVTVERVLSTADKLDVRVYPNPSSQNFTLSTFNSYSSLYIKSIDGREIDYALVKKGDETLIDITDEYKGLLILEVVIEGQKFVRKLIKH